MTTPSPDNPAPERREMPASQVASPPKTESARTERPGSDRFGPLVAEIRQRLASLAQRELAVQRREHELDEEHARVVSSVREGSHPELAEARARLQEREEQLAARAVDIDRHRAAIRRRNVELRAQAERLEREKANLVEAARRLKERKKALHEARERDRAELSRKVTTHQELEQELQRRLLLARNEITQQREDLAAQQHQLEQERQQFESRRGELELAEQEAEARQRMLDELAAETEPLHSELKAREARLEEAEARFNEESGRRRTELEEAQRRAQARLAADARSQEESLSEDALKLEAQIREDAQRCEVEFRTRVERQEAEFAERVRRQEAESSEAARHREARLDADEERLESERAGMRDKRRELAEQWRQTRARRGELTRASDEVAAERRILEQQRGELEQREQEAANREQQFQEQLAQFEARESEARQAELRLDLHLQELEGRQVAQRAREAELTRAREELIAEYETAAIMARERAAAARPPRFWLRSLAIAAIAAVGAGVAVWVTQPSSTRTSLEIEIATESEDASLVARQHAVALLDSERVAAVLDGGAAELWQSYAARGAISAQPIPGQTAIEVAATGPNPGENALLLRTLVDSYVAAVNNAPSEPQLPPAYQDLGVRRVGVAAELLALTERMAEVNTQLESLPVADDHDARTADVARLRETYTATGARIAQQREQVQTVEAELPHGEIDADALERALAADAVYQQDLKEFAEAARQYQRELGVALLMLAEPAAQARAASRTLLATVVEQRDLQPPPSVRAVLEDAQLDAERVDTELETLVQALPVWQRQLEALDVSEDAADLVTLHNAVIEAVGGVVDETRGLAERMEAHATTLSAQDDGGTRHIVVAAVLRSDTRQFADSAALLANAVKAVSFKDNFELDAQNHQIRGLRGRLNQRSQAMMDQLQVAADRRAADDHALRVTAERDALRALEDDRERWLIEFADAVDALRAVDQQLLARRQFEVELAVLEKQQSQLEAQLDRLDTELSEMRRSATDPDRIPPPDTAFHHQVVAGQDRDRRAAAAGGAAFVLVWLAAMLFSAHGKRETT